MSSPVRQLSQWAQERQPPSFQPLRSSNSRIITRSWYVAAWICEKNQIDPKAYGSILGHYQINGETRRGCPGWNAIVWSTGCYRAICQDCRMRLQLKPEARKNINVKLQ